MCLQYMISIFAPFRSRSYVRSSRWPLILHFTFIPTIHFSTPRLREILISISQASFIPFSPSPFPTLTQWYVFHFCGEFAPLNRLTAERKVITPYQCVVVRSANIRTTIRPHHPSVVQKIKTFRVDYPCACGQCIHSSPLHSRNYVRSSLRTLTFHSAFILCTHLSTAPLR